MASGIILGFFTGYIYGIADPKLFPSNITQVNYSLLQSLVKNQGYNREDIIKIYQANKILKDSEMSNDSLMRSTPLVFVPDLSSVIQDTNLTNPNPVNRDADLLYVLALKLALQKKNPKDIFAILQKSAQTNEILTILSYIAQGQTLDMTPDNILTGFYASIAPFVHADIMFQNWTEGVEWVTRLGGNQAVNAALAGSLLGAYFGSDRMFDEQSFAEKQTILLGQFPQLYELIDEIKYLFPSFVSDLSRRLFLAYRKSLNEMKKWVSQSQWNFFESRQHFIQIVFPILGPEISNNDFVPNEQEIDELSKNKDFVMMMNEAFKAVLAFYGLVPIGNKINISDKERFLTYFIQGGSGGHNHPRITRILTSLRLFQQFDLYSQLKEVTNQVAEAYPQHISAEIKNSWSQA